MMARPSFLGLMFVLSGLSPAVAESADNDQPLVLRGRVVDTSGNPVGGVIVTIRVWPRAVEGIARMPQELNIRGKMGPGILADNDGRYQFQAPPELDQQSTYQARVDPPGREPAETSGLRPSAQGKTEFADLIVRRVTIVSGRVVDRAGRGVGGAKVFQAGDLSRRVQTATAADGRFRLDGALADPTFVFVTKPGFRFYGRLLAGHEQAATFILTRTEEPAEAWHSLAPALSKEERAELARKVLEPCLEKAEIEGEARAAVTLEALAVIDPPALLARLHKKPLKSASLLGFLKQRAIKALAADDPDEALAVIATLDDPYPRSEGYLNVVDSLGGDQRARKLELLGQAMVSVRQISSPFVRMSYLGQTAERLLDLGDCGQAANLLREGEKLAHELPRDELGECARGAFAEELGQIDLPAALELMKGLADVREYDRHHGNLAHELAAKDPAEAERLLTMLHRAQERSQAQEPYDLWGVRVCYRMAPVDLPRAQRIVDTMFDPYLKAQAYGVIAQAIAKSEPRAARESIERAFGVLEKLAIARETAPPGGKGSPTTFDDYNGQFSASSLAGSLLPAVEAVDPALVPEYAWRAVSFRLPRVGDDADQINASRANAALAMMLARYNRELAEAIFKPGRVFGSSPDPGLAALVLIDPARAATAIEKQLDAEHADHAARAEMAELLVLEGDALWRKLNDILGLWSIDVEDVF